MLKFGNKEFRNLQEQVEENMKDIEKLKNGQAVLDEFGIKVVGEVESVDDLPTVSEYKELAPDWEYGDAYAVGTVAPYTLYILTRANGTHEADYWFDIGEFPAVGPQGPQGPQGPEGQQGQTGDTGPAGADAGFGVPTATATMTAKGSAPTVNVTASGPNTEKVFNFDFYLPVATPKVTITSVSGTLTLADYNILYNFEDSVVVFKPSSSLANTAYTLQRWYANDDYIVFICLYNYTPYKTGVYRCRVDRSNRNYLIYADEAIKINKYNISTAINSTTNETAGKVLTADGNGGASWETASGSGAETVTLTTLVGNLSDSDYIKVAGNGCVIIYDDNTTKVYFKKYEETSTTITYATTFSEGSSTYSCGIEITKATKYYQIQSAYMPISNSNIKSGSTIADKYLKTNGSGGAVWGDAPSQVQSDWNESSQSSPAYIKNKPTIPTVPVTDVTVNGTSVMDGTTAKVLVDTVDGATDGTNWTSLTINGTTAAIPQGSAQVQADWTESDTTAPSYIQNKPTLATVATSGSYNDLSNKPTIPAAQVNSDWDAASGIAQILNKPSLATVATSGSYNDLSNKPTIPDVSNMVTTDTTQTISGTKAFKSLVVTDNYNDNTSLIAGNDLFTIQVDGGANTFNFSDTYLSTTNNNQTDLGTSTYKFKNLYLAGNLSDGTNSIAIADIANKSNIPSISGTNDGTNWTSLTINSDTYSIPGNSTPSNMVTTDTVQTITAVKYVTNNLHATTLYFEGSQNQPQIATDTTGSLLVARTNEFRIQNPTSNYSLITPDMSLWTGNKTIATTDQIPTVPTNVSSFTNDAGYITGINSSDVTTALGYTPYSDANPSGYTSNVGTVTSVNNISPDANGNVSLSIPSAVTSINGLSGGTLTSPLNLSGGDQSTAAKVAVSNSASGQFTDENTNTIFGFLSNNTDTLTVGGTSYKLNLRGSYGQTRPTYQAGSSPGTKKDLALYSDINVANVEINGSSILSNRIANIITNTAYNASTNKIATMSDISAACTYQTTAPTAAISDGGVHIVYLSSEPSTKYSGYIYMIAEA